MKIDVETQRLMEGGYMFAAKISDHIEEAAAHALLREIVQQIAEKYVAENYQQIVAGMSQEAIATLSVAESAAKIRESLERKIPERIMEIERTKTEVWQRGLLGGTKRIR